MKEVNGLKYFIYDGKDLPHFNAYDSCQARIHRNRYNGKIILDEYEKPIDNEFDLAEIEKVEKFI